MREPPDLREHLNVECLVRQTIAPFTLPYRRRWTALAISVLCGVSLAGCGSISEETAHTALLKPGKYDISTCEDIETQTASMRTRQIELEQLMARASQGAGGEFVNAIAYRSEYALTRAELVGLAKSKADKHCAIDSRFSSGRSVF